MKLNILYQFNDAYAPYAGVSICSLLKNNQKAEAIAAGIDWISPEEKLRMEEEEADRVAEEARKEELRTKCLKKGLDFEAEEAKYQTRMAEKRRIAEEKAKRKLKK